MCDFLYRTSVELSLDATLYPFLLRAGLTCVDSCTDDRDAHCCTRRVSPAPDHHGVLTFGSCYFTAG